MFQLTSIIRPVGQMLKILHQKNVNKSKNNCSPVKLESKKQDKKNIGLAGGFGQEAPIKRQEEVVSHLYPLVILYYIFNDAYHKNSLIKI